ncbi:MAG: MBL fold metallo-hydrolase [Nitrospirae bacterium]|nr:MBL fold metallo-hydrolase [Nitrospirota bacterium]
MNDIANLNLDYNRPVKIAEGVYWVGFFDKESGLHCNPYLIVDGDEAMVIDGGSRPDFPTVMMKILQTGLNPDSIKALIYQHYDPDLCGSLSNFEDIIGSKELKIISEKTNNVFIRHYYVTSDMMSIDEMGYSYKFSSGRTLRFIKTPYAHSTGSFVTLDEQTGVLFSSDLFGSYSRQWELFLKLEEDCRTCTDYKTCSKGKSDCPIHDILNFHQKLMPSGLILRYAIERIAENKFTLVAPQHGSIISRKEDILLICEKLLNLEAVGIDSIIEDIKVCELGDLTCLKKMAVENGN